MTRPGKELIMKQLVGLGLGLALLAGTSGAAVAQTAPGPDQGQTGHWEVKLLGTAVLPDGKITDLRVNVVNLPATSQTTASNNNFVPTIAAEYYFTKNISLETICCTTAHHVTGAGPLAGDAIVDHVVIVPATFTAKYHLPLGFVAPYVGVGPSVFIYRGERPGAVAASLGAASVRLDSNLGFAAQAGVDIPLTKNGLGLTLDAKRYWMKTTAHFYTAGGVEALQTRHALDPWVLSAGAYWRF